MASEQKRDAVFIENASNEAIKRKDYKLIVDPQIKKGQERLLRYDGDSYSTENHGQGVVVLRDPRPRMNRLWSRRERAELPVPRYKVDEWYVGAVPPREVTFSRLNDNITKQFMEKMCVKLGKLERVRVYHHPKTQKHMGLSKVVFSSIKSASECVKKLHMTSIMGNVIHAQIDCKGEILNQLYQKIVRGEMMAETIPDVIRHTQDGITMSNKYKEHNRHHHTNKKERRKSSQDDPRKLRKSLDGHGKQNSKPHRHGPKTPPISEVEHDVRENQINENNVAAVDFSSHEPKNKDTCGSISPRTHLNQKMRENRDDGVCKMKETKSGKPPTSKNVKIRSKDTELESHTKGGSFEENEPTKTKHVWTSDLESRISSLLSEQTKKYKLNEVSQNSTNSDSTEIVESPVPASKEYENSSPSCVPNKKKHSKVKNKRHSSVDSATLEDGECSFNDAKAPHESFEQQGMINRDHDRHLDFPTKDQCGYERSMSPPRYMDSRQRSPPDRRPLSPGHQGIFDESSRSPKYVSSKSRNRRRSASPRHSHYMDHPHPQHHISPDREKRMYSPRYHRRHDHSPRQHSPRYERERRPHEFLDRRPPPREFGYPEDPENLYSHLHSSNFPYRRHKMSPDRIPHSPRRHRPHMDRWRSPERYPGRLPHPHQPHPSRSPPRMVYYRRSRSRERSPGFLRRMSDSDRHRDFPRHMQSPGFDSRNQGLVEEREHNDKMRDGRYWRSRSPDQRDSTNPEEFVPRVKEETSKPALERKKSSDHESPKLSLDQRLKEMTGESIAVEETKLQSIKTEELDDTERDDDSSMRSDGSSVDMEISEGESDGEKAEKLRRMTLAGEMHQNMNNAVPNTNQGMARQIQNPDGWNFHNVPWNEFRPRMDMAMHSARMWNMHDMMQPNHPDFLKGLPGDQRFPGPVQTLSQFPHEQWESQFHPGMPHPGMHPPFPNNQPVISSEEHKERLKDEHLARGVLDNIICDLKGIVGRDLNRKIIETMAFKVYEAWWDENANNQKQVKSSNLPLQSENTNIANQTVKPEPVSESQFESKENHSANKGPNKNLLNSFDPLNWAKNSFEMDGFRIGLGLRSAISKMPSFRVKRQRTPTPPRKTVSEQASEVDKKKRKLDNKENQEKEPSKKSRGEKKYQHKRISVLDSEGEDEEENSEEDESENSESDTDKKSPRYKVLDVDEIFSESSGSSDESDSDRDSEEEQSSDVASDSEDETTKGSEVHKRKHLHADSDHVEEEPNKILKLDEEKNIDQPLSPDKSLDIPQTPDAQPTSEPLASSLLSPTASSVAGTLTPQQLRHVHPKKRHRLISHDNVSDKLRSDDELSMMSDKEKTALEALADMQMSPDRRHSTQSTDSNLSLSNLPRTPGAPGAPSPKTKFGFLKGPDHATEGSSDSAPHHELEAVEALLSIKKSLPPLSPSTPKVKPISESMGKSYSWEKLPPIAVPISNEEKMRTENLAEEHNYFAPSFSPKRPDPNIDPKLAQILEEHSYSRSALEPEVYPPIHGPHSPASTLSATSIFNFEDSASELISAAERVKLRREQKKERPLKKSTSHRERKNFKDTLHYTPRTQVEELIILYEMWNTGLDLEDLKYLREVYDGLLEKANSPAWVNDSHWVPHPVTKIIDTSASSSKKRRGRSKKDKASDDAEPHATGSSRTEGYYQLAAKVKLKQRRQMYGEGKKSAVPEGQSGCGNGAELVSGSQKTSDPCKNLGSRENRHFMRRIASEVGSDAGDLFKYNQLMFRKKAVKFKRSSIHGWGLFAEEAIGADEMVIEYVGQVVRTHVAERREVHYTEVGIGSSYLFRIDSDHIIDATKCGNYARFMNHSCNPSCYAKVITVDTAKKIVIYSKGPIKKRDEITYDYKFPLEDDKIMCFCGAENCRRTLN